MFGQRQWRSAHRHDHEPGKSWLAACLQDDTVMTVDSQDGCSASTITAAVAVPTVHQGLGNNRTGNPQ
jgi:hypothetical protein